MKKRNRLTALTLAMALSAAGWQAGPVRAAEAADTEETTEEVVTAVQLPGSDYSRVTHLNVGVTTPLSGHFFTGMWGRNTSDEDIRALLHGYDLVRWNGEHGYFEPDDTVVRTLTVLQNTEGDRSYVFTLRNDLYYSDGTPITAWDYAFSVLLSISPEIAELGGIPENKEYLKGYTDYLQGSVPSLSGVRVLSDDMLMFTVGHEYLPYFYELGRMSCLPYPIQVIAPGVEVRDEGEGIFLANEVLDADEDGVPDELRYNAEVLLETISDEETGYMNHPQVVSGPYNLVSWDGTTAELERNEYFKDYTGYTLRYSELNEETGETEIKERFVPYIENLSVFYLEDTQVVNALEHEQVDLVNKVTRAETIQNSMLLMRSQEPEQREISMTNYPRTGLGYISINCEREEMTQNVRQALAYAMNRTQVASDYTGGFGLKVDGYYGIGQWMYGLAAGNTLPPVTPPENADDAEAQAAYEAELAAWEALNMDNLNPYEQDLTTAAALLDADGWVINEETGIREKHIPLTEDELLWLEGNGLGTPVDPSRVIEDENGNKYRVIDLDLHIAYAEQVDIAKSLEENWVANLAQIGIRMTLVPMEYEAMTRLYYGWDDRSESDIDMFFRASNFDIAFDPLTYFSTEESSYELIQQYLDMEEEAQAARQGAEPAAPTEESLVEETEDLAEAEEGVDSARSAGGAEAEEGRANYTLNTWSYTQLEDEELYRLALDMRMTEPEDVLGYVTKWVAFQERFNELVPIIPIYSNVYFDFYETDLHNYNVAQSLSWSSSIIDARLYHEEETEEAVEEEVTEESEEEFVDESEEESTEDSAEESGEAGTEETAAE